MVTRAEFESALPIGSMVTQVLTKLLALAADKSGRIDANYEPSEIFDKHILAALEMEPDDVTTPIRYDLWTAMVMTESVYFLVNACFLAHRGGGDHAASSPKHDPLKPTRPNVQSEQSPKSPQAICWAGRPGAFHQPCQRGQGPSPVLSATRSPVTPGSVPHTPLPWT